MLEMHRCRVDNRTPPSNPSTIDFPSGIGKQQLAMHPYRNDQLLSENLGTGVDGVKVQVEPEGNTVTSGVRIHRSPDRHLHTECFQPDGPMIQCGLLGQLHPHARCS